MRDLFRRSLLTRVGRSPDGTNERPLSRIWITWEKHRRSESLSRELGMRLFCFDRRGGRLARYAVATWRTLRTLVRERPTLIFVQNPSLVLALLAVEVGRWTAVPVIVDAHNAGIEPPGSPAPLLRRLADRAIRRAAVTIVTNQGLALRVRERGGRPVVLPDPLPLLSSAAPLKPPPRGATVLFVCSWATDEPYLEVIRAASLLDPSVRVFITGNSKGREREYGERLPPNVILTGYLDDDDYLSLLHASDVVVDLTTRENCLVCGAYEAVAAGKPLIVSDTVALRDWFSRGTLYTSNAAADIAAQIRRALEQQDALTSEMRGFQAALGERWTSRREALERILETLV